MTTGKCAYGCIWICYVVFLMSHMLIFLICHAGPVDGSAAQICSCSMIWTFLGFYVNA